jgi:serine protease Do
MYRIASLQTGLQIFHHYRMSQPKMSQRKTSKQIRRKLFQWLWTLTVATPAVASLVCVVENSAFGQSPAFAGRGNVPISVNTGGDIPSNAKQRDDQYAQIAQEVDLIERQHSLLRRVVRLVAPTVVHIEAIKDEAVADRSITNSKLESRNPRSETRKVEEAGSGVIVQIGNHNYVITNRHVIHSATLSNLKVETHDGVSLKPVRVWEDPSTDIAVIDINRNNLSSAKLADSRQIEMGDFVFAVGSPFGLNHSVSYGIVSAKGRRNLELGSKAIVYQDFIQTDAAINPGNSGGPLMNLRGEVIGINTAIASNSGGNEGIGFSIPINVAMAVSRQLVEKGELQRSYLGVSVERAFRMESNSQPGDTRPRGAFVKVIKPNSPAELAGIRYGDVILQLDGTSVDNDEHLVQLVGLTTMDRPVEVILLRDSKELRILVDLIPVPVVH